MSRKRPKDLRRLNIACGYDPDTIDIGASIACSGICLTVVERGRAGNRSSFAVDTAAETLRVTTAGSVAARHAGSISNVRCGLATSSAATWSAAMSTALPNSSAATTSSTARRCRFACPAELARFIAPKGSVALDGISLTVNDVERRRLLGAHHSAHLEGHHARRAAAGRPRQSRSRPDGALCGAACWNRVALIDGDGRSLAKMLS